MTPMQGQRPSFFTVLYPMPGYGLVAPYAFPTPNGPIIVEVAYNFGDCKYRELRMGLPQGVTEVEPGDIKD